MQLFVVQYRVGVCMRVSSWITLFVIISCNTLAVAAADSLSTSLERGPLLDFNGDGDVDTLYVTAQQLDRNGHRVARRLLPAFIAWHADTTTDADTTNLDVDVDAKASIGIRLADVNGDGITDIELQYRWRPKKSDKADNAKNASRAKDAHIQEHIWLIEGGSALRQMKLVDLHNGRKPAQSSLAVVSDRSTTSRSNETSVGIGSFAVRRIAERSQMPKKLDEQPAQPAAVIDDVVKATPNPVRDRLLVQWKVAGNVTTVDVVDIAGRVVLSAPADHAAAGLDVRTLAAGTYVVRINGCDLCPRSSTIVVVR